MNDAMLLPAFTEPIAQSQQAFRLALTAMSEPGTIQVLEGGPALGDISPATYALCLSLFDADTPVWLSDALDTPALRANLAFHCGCAVASDRRLAAFALLTEDDQVDLHEFNSGTDRDPDRSCTLIVQLSDLQHGAAVAWQGPGIQQERVLNLPVAPDFWTQRKTFCAFPKGLDIFFTSGSRLVALPRSTRVRYTMTEVN
ncbi:phosphonate C-P lyase system protein PhnH [Pollutimonas nitritireducens]|uniref:Phosphonate C-P lyase system protein PhnH n=1 Tax=Pollutimonas nitritireducens TaxID=2045209 RepID=A0A2N4UBZ0_9BURK|nr:phosphonate C-P lyase system protein PhnH [Pollutimonas nitritireducens]PLC52535.1 phosphonate C-P lyase system protein PhnH [Pollutimonas nitritireducens]